MIKFHVRDIMHMEAEEVWNMALRRDPVKMKYEYTVGTPVALTFDDGVTKMASYSDIAISWYLWRIGAYFNGVEVNSDLFLDGRILDDNLTRELFYIAVNSTRHLDVDKEKVWAVAMYEMYGKLFNAIAKYLHPFASSTSYLDINDLIQDPDMLAANAKVSNSQTSIDRAHRTVDKVFKKPQWQSNPLVNALRYRTVKAEQLYQSIGPVGKKTDVDSDIYGSAIRPGFAIGIRHFADFAKETLTSSKSLLAQTDPVKMAEWFNRKLQLVCNVLERIVPGDCGTTTYLDFPINNRNDIDVILGLDIKVDSKIVRLKKIDEALIGRTVGVRTTLSCLHLHGQRVCETCYGETSYAIPHDTNPGHVSCTALNKIISQLIISTKHLDFIRQLLEIFLRGAAKDYLEKPNAETEYLHIRAGTKLKGMRMLFPSKDAPNLVDVNYITKFVDGETAKISTLTAVALNWPDEKTGFNGDYVELDLLQSDIPASLTEAALFYIRDNGWEKDDHDNIVVDMSKWDIRKPLFVYPMRYPSMSEYRAHVERFIRSTTEHLGEQEGASAKKLASNRGPMLTQYNEYGEDATSRALYDAHHLVAKKLKGVHLGHIATMLATTRVASAKHHDWNMPAHPREGMFRSHEEILSMRSLSNKLLYQDQIKTILSMRSYLVKNRPHSVMDSTQFISERDRYN